MKVVFHPQADDDYWMEREYYAQVNQLLAKRFEVAVDTVLNQITQNPFLCHNRGNGVYGVRLQGFPFSIFI